MGAHRYVLLVGLGLLPSSLWAQSAASKSARGSANPPAATSATSKAGLPTAAHSGAHLARPMRPDGDGHYQPAAYAGGTQQLEQDLQRAVRYPAAALRAGASGRVLVSFYVEPSGTVSEPRIVKSPSPLLDEAVLQAMRGLRPFAPAQQDGRPVRSQLTYPVTFNITGSTTGSPLRSAPLVVPLAREAVQLPAPTHHSVLVAKLVSFRDSLYGVENDAYWLEKDKRKRITVFQHYFTYDTQGRPATHLIERRASGRLVFTQRLRYTYGPDGRLLAKGNSQNKSLFEYTQAGQLRRIALAQWQNQQWVTVEETLLQEKAPQPGHRVLSLATNHRRGELMENYCTIDYTVATDQSVVSSAVQRYSYRSWAAPTSYGFVQDTQPNPLRELMMEPSYYQFEWERGGPHNLLRETENGQPFKFMTYRYDEAGNPAYCLISNGFHTPTRDQTFTYAAIRVPAPLQSAADSTTSVAIYPNPARSTATVSAATIGKGTAMLRLFSLNGQLLRETVYSVADTFHETIAVADLAAGVYIVEISNHTAVSKGRLVVD